MVLSFTKFSWWLFGGKEEEQVSNGSSINSLAEWGVGLRGESESLKFYSLNGGNRKMPSSSSDRKMKRKWTSTDERKGIDKEYDAILVPLDGVCLTGSESDDLDWSIGWLEPHAPDFQSDNEADGSFAVLVPCYRHQCKKFEEVKEPGNYFLNAIKNFPNEYSDGKY
ncbi:Uncharacterized protein Adt_20126 [Abeliophyllum distichum]|uniref:Uncharacterized protein n=1 Tax=Abeliophyllum distichum TaxID=126358 RepID=A0ABD1SUW3_9LAMI